MTIRAGFLSGGMRRAEILDIPNRDILFCGTTDTAYTSLEMASSHLGYLPPFFGSTPGVIDGIFDCNKNVRRMLTYSSKGFIQMIDMDRWAFIADVIANPVGMTCIRFSNSGQYYALCSSGSGVRIYDTNSFREMQTVLTDKTPTFACWSQGDRYLAVSLVETPYLRVYDTSTWSALSGPATLPSGQGNSVSFSRGADLVAVGHNDSPYFSEYLIPGLSKVANPSYLTNGDVIHIRYSPIRNILIPVTAETESPVYTYDYAGTHELVATNWVPVGWDAHFLDYDARGFISHSDSDGEVINLAVSTDFLNVYYSYNTVFRNEDVPTMRLIFSNHAVGI